MNQFKEILLTFLIMPILFLGCFIVLKIFNLTTRDFLMFIYGAFISFIIFIIANNWNDEYLGKTYRKIENESKKSDNDFWGLNIDFPEVKIQKLLSGLIKKLNCGNYNEKVKHIIELMASSKRNMPAIYFGNSFLIKGNPLGGKEITKIAEFSCQDNDKLKEFFKFKDKFKDTNAKIVIEYLMESVALASAINKKLKGTKKDEENLFFIILFSFQDTYDDFDKANLLLGDLREYLDIASNFGRNIINN